MKQLYFKQNTRIKLDRVLPKSADMCKLSTFANAMNYYGFYKKYGYKLTPEKLLTIINNYRRRHGLKHLTPNKNVIPSTDLITVSKKLGIVKVKEVSGKYLADPEKWSELIDKGSLIAPYHQMVYWDRKFMNSSTIKNIEHNGKYNYRTFLKLVKDLVGKFGSFDNGHVDIVLDIKRQAGKLKVVLANLVSEINDYPISLDWNLFTKYLFWDWASKEIHDHKQLPTQHLLERLKKKGRLKYKDYEFYWGSALVFSRADQTLISH